MTIQRKYSLPNCTLLLEGLSEASADGMSDVRPLISILVNAECHFAASGQRLSGGRDFFESLVTATSGYAQEFLSKVHHPEAHKNEAGLVQLQKVDNNRHRLIVQTDMAQGLDFNSSSAQPPHASGSIQIDLTTVQLFDLVEAVDQFFADSQTLPDLTLQLSPASKRYGDSSQALVKQAVPAAVGMSSLALAAVAFFLVPIPEVPPSPTQPSPQSNSSQSTIPTNGSNGSNGSSNLEATLAAAPKITNPSQLVALNQKLYDQLNQAWKTRSTVEQNLVYRVGVARDGAIVGYKAVEPVASDRIQQTPLPNLLVNPAARRASTQEPLAQFKVVFTDNGELQVSPW